MQPDPLDLTSQDLAADQAAKRASLAEVQATEDLRRLMALPWGRRIMARVLNSTSVESLSFNRDPIAMAFNEGQRMEGIKWLAEVKRVAFSDYLKMLKESNG